MIPRNQQTSSDPTGPSHPNYEQPSKDSQLEIQTSYSVPSNPSRWRNCSRSRSVNSGLGVVVPIGLVGMVSQRGKRSSMLSGWDSGVRVRGARVLLEVDCDWARVNYDEGESGVTILMSHGYCMIFRYAHRLKHTIYSWYSSGWHCGQGLYSPVTTPCCGIAGGLFFITNQGTGAVFRHSPYRYSSTGLGIEAVLVRK